MKRLTLLITLALVGGCAASSAPSAAAPTPSGPPAAAVASPPGVPSTGQAGSGTSVTCTLPADVCGDAVRAVEAVSALDAAGMPPTEVAILDFAECRTVTGAPEGYDPCAASIPMPAEPSATGGGDGLATVTYRDGLGTAFLYVWWRTFPSGRGPISAVVEAHNP